MRIALISDIHGHAIALDAVLGQLGGEQLDAVVCLGDVATIGPEPNRTVDALRRLGCMVVMGNHDAAVLEPAAAERYQIAPVLAQALDWCVRQLTPENLAYLRTFKPTVELSLAAGADLLCFHGSPRSNTDIVLATTPAETVDALFAGHEATIMAGGHTHMQLLRQHAGRLIVNPGSVGSAFLTPPAGLASPTLLPFAEYAILSATGGAISVELRRVDFDCAAFLALVARSDIPIKDWWLQQYGGAAA